MDLGAKCRVLDGNRLCLPEIGAASLKMDVGYTVHQHIKVAGFPVWLARQAVFRNSQRRTLLDSSWNTFAHGALLLHTAAAAALRTWPLDGDTGSLAGLTGLGRIAASGTLPMTVGTNYRPAVAHALVAALCDALQRNFQRDSQIGPAGRSYGSPPEKTVEDAVAARPKAEAQVAEEAAQIHVPEQVVV